MTEAENTQEPLTLEMIRFSVQGETPNHMIVAELDKVYDIDIVMAVLPNSIDLGVRVGIVTKWNRINDLKYQGEASIIDNNALELID